MNYPGALLYLNKLPNYEKVPRYNYKREFKLERMKNLLFLLGNPQDSYLSVIVAGTKGKGSVVSVLAAVLAESGIKTGVYTSPHLIDIKERIKIGDNPILPKDFAYCLSAIKKVIAKHKIDELTFFEILTALAFYYFARKKVKIAVLEVGLGGRLDAANAAGSSVCAITSISFDHTHLLGNSLADIAGEKCGVIKKGSFVISAPQPEEVLRVIKKRCLINNAKLSLVGKDITIGKVELSRKGSTVDITTEDKHYGNLKLPLIGRHQAINTAVAVGALEVLKKKYSFRIGDKDIREGLKNAVIAGRFQIVSKNPHIILDGAHNSASAKVLGEAVKALFGKKRIFLILGISSDKDIEGIGRRLCPLAEEVIFTRAESLRAEPPQFLAERLSRFCRNSFLAHDIKDALIFAKAASGNNDVILVTGSLFLVADALKTLEVRS